MSNKKPFRAVQLKCVAITYEEQNELLTTEHRNGVHKYMSLLSSWVNYIQISTGVNVIYWKEVYRRLMRHLLMNLAKQHPVHHWNPHVLLGLLAYDTRRQRHIE